MSSSVSQNAVAKLPRCLVCRSTRRIEMEHALANSIGIRVLARRFGVSKDCLQRHRRNHMPANLVASLKARGHLIQEKELEDLRIAESKSLLSHLVAQRGRLHHLVSRALEATDFRAATAGEGKILENLTATGRLLGEFGATTQHVTNNTLVISPQYLALRSALLQALRPAMFRDARMAVARALSSVEGQKPEMKQVASIAIEASNNGKGLARDNRTLGVESPISTVDCLDVLDGSVSASGSESGPATDDIPIALPTIVAAQPPSLAGPILFDEKEAVTPEPSTTVIRIVR